MLTTSCVRFARIAFGTMAALGALAVDSRDAKADPPPPPDACQVNADCDPNMTCVLDDGPNYCACKPGFREGLFGCDDINECWEGSDNCSDNAACVNRVGTFTCRCNAGYVGNGVSCTPASRAGRGRLALGVELPADGGEDATEGGEGGSDEASTLFAAASDDDDASDDSDSDTSETAGMCSAGPGGADPSAIATLLAAAAIIASRRRKS